MSKLVLIKLWDIITHSGFNFNGGRGGGGGGGGGGGMLKHFGIYGIAEWLHIISILRK